MRMGRWGIIATGSIAAFSTSASARADDAAPRDDSAAPGSHRERRFRRWPLIAGPAVFAGGYAWSVIAGAEAEIVEPGARPYLRWLYVPVVGPFVAAARYHSASSLQNVVYDTGYVFEGVVQIAGLALLAYGLAAPETVVVPGVSVAPMPVVLGGSGAGIGVIGTF
jgi:hypothetical protein